MRVAKTDWAASTCAKAAGMQTCTGDMTWPGEVHSPFLLLPSKCMFHYIVTHVSVIWAQSSGGSEDSQCQGEMFREVRSGAGLGEERGPRDDG